MDTAVRARTAALGITAIAALTSIGLAGNPSLAAADPTTTSTTAAAVQSSGHPTTSLKYADELVRAFGTGSDVDVESLATDAVVKPLI